MKKIFLIIIVLLYELSQPFIILSQTVSPEVTPQISPATITPITDESPTPSPIPLVSESSPPETAPSPMPASASSSSTDPSNLTPAPEISPMIPLQTPIEESTVEATTQTFQPDTSPSATTFIVPAFGVSITQDTKTDSQKNVDVNTGNQPINPSQTSSASVNASITNTINMNSVGSDIYEAIINSTVPNSTDIDLSNTAYCQKIYSDQDSLMISQIVNNAQVNNIIDVNVNTGISDITFSSGSLQTGNATAKAFISNIINTNLVGNCGFFNVVNLFEKQKGDIILPYELGFLQSDQISDSISSIPKMYITNTNTASIITRVEEISNPGNNTVAGNPVKTIVGDTNSSTTIIDQVNSNFIGNRWILMTINNYGNWNGNLLNWWGNYYQPNTHSIYAWANLDLLTPTHPGFGELNSEITNNANIYNQVSLTAASGNNNYIFDSGILKTGNTQTIANIFDMLNTNIVGNHWYYSTINIFDDFKGNIILPRPDLNVTLSSDSSTAHPGDEINYVIRFGNKGKLWAKNIKLINDLSPYVTIKNVSSGVNIENNRISWVPGELQPGDNGTENFTIIVNKDIPTNNVVDSVFILSETPEPQLDNNYDSNSVTIERKISKDNTPLSDDKEVSTNEILLKQSSYSLQPKVSENNNGIMNYHTPITFTTKGKVLSAVYRSPKYNQNKSNMSECLDFLSCHPITIFLLLLLIYQSAGLTMLNLYEKYE